GTGVTAKRVQHGPERLTGVPGAPLGAATRTPVLLSWRKGWDLNPRGSSPCGFQDRCLRPLGHPSAPGRSTGTTACALAFYRVPPVSVHPTGEADGVKPLSHE